MSLLAVDPGALTDCSAAVAAVACRLDQTSAEVRALAVHAGASTGPALPALAGRMAAIGVRTAGLARVTALVADALAETETRIAATMTANPDAPGAQANPHAAQGIWPFLQTLAPGDLAALLVSCPALARIVVDGRAALAPGSTAARLAALLRSGEPSTVVLRQGRELLLRLSGRGRQLLALLHPALVSGLASAPVALREVATRVLVSAEIARLRAHLLGRSASVRAAGLGRLRWYGELLTGTVTLIRPDGTRLVRPHQLLAFDPRGDGRIMEIFGDPATARHLAVYVPGTGTSLDRYAGNAERASAFAAAAPDLAVVLWQDADFPDLPLDHVVPPPVAWSHPVLATQEQLRAHVLSAAYRDAADRAGPLLAHDVEGLRMALPGPGADVTVLGHSYGGSVVGSAEAHGLVVERIVHISSAGGYVDDVREYAAGECGTRRFAMTDLDDPIQLSQGAGLGSLDQVGHSVRAVAGVLPAPLKPFAAPVVGALGVVSGGPLHVGHGLDPDHIPALTRLDPGVRADGHTLVSGHGGMFDSGSTGWHNLLAVMRGGPVGVLEPERWSSRVVPAAVDVHVGAGGVDVAAVVPHIVVTRSPYSAPGYQPPVQASTGPVCAGPGSW